MHSYLPKIKISTIILDFLAAFSDVYGRFIIIQAIELNIARGASRQILRNSDPFDHPLYLDFLLDVHNWSPGTG
jgi:hypothetical protein